ncbi:hypothetical protein FRB90_001612 [Tulasnella sp. 427]|nr:hypothetical protein FRB90_001612 [Tulasnella sp. 427]
MIYHEQSSSLRPTFRGQICSFLTDSATNTKENKARLLDSQLLGAARIGALLATAEDYPLLETLLELIYVLRPKSSTPLVRKAYLEDLFLSRAPLKAFGNEAAQLLAQIVSDAEAPSMHKSFALLYQTMGDANDQKPQGFRISELRSIGRFIDLPQDQQVVYIDRTAIFVPFPNEREDGAPLSMEVPLSTIDQLQFFQPQAKKSLIQVTLNLSTVPIVAGETMEMPSFETGHLTLEFETCHATDSQQRGAEIRSHNRSPVTGTDASPCSSPSISTDDQDRAYGIESSGTIVTPDPRSNYIQARIQGKKGQNGDIGSGKEHARSGFGTQHTPPSKDESLTSDNPVFPKVLQEEKGPSCLKIPSDPHVLTQLRKSNTVDATHKRPFQPTSLEPHTSPPDDSVLSIFQGLGKPSNFTHRFFDITNPSARMAVATASPVSKRPDEAAVTVQEIFDDVKSRRSSEVGTSHTEVCDRFDIPYWDNISTVNPPSKVTLLPGEPQRDELQTTGPRNCEKLPLREDQSIKTAAPCVLMQPKPPYHGSTSDHRLANAPRRERDENILKVLTKIQANIADGLRGRFQGIRNEVRIARDSVLEETRTDLEDIQERSIVWQGQLRHVFGNLSAQRRELEQAYVTLMKGDIAGAVDIRNIVRGHDHYVATASNADSTRLFGDQGGLLLKMGFEIPR